MQGHVNVRVRADIFRDTSFDDLVGMLDEATASLMETRSTPGRVIEGTRVVSFGEDDGFIEVVATFDTEDVD